MADNPYDDPLSPEEEKLLDDHIKNGPEPVSEDDGGPSVDQVAAEAGVDTKGNKEPAPVVTPEPAPAVVDADADRAAFLEKHKDKTPEQLADLAWQQQKRANREAYDHRQAQERVQGRITAIQQRRNQLGQERERFQQRLAEDPDAATRELHERLLTQDEQELEIAEHNTRIDAGIELARQAIPDFDQVAPEIFSFANEMGYTNEELAELTDGRALSTLYLARVAGNLMKANVINLRGQLLQGPSPVAETVTDPRLANTAPQLRTHSSAAGRTSAGRTLEQQLEDLLNMNEADFERASNDPNFQNLLRAAG